jgi:hypothetical protein
MLFKSPEIGLQWLRCHHKTKEAVTSIDAQVQLWRLPELTITSLARTHAENTTIYLGTFLREGHEPAEALAMAEEKLSYHLEGVECAADFRSSGEPYSPSTNDRIHGWMKDQFPSDRYEVLFHDVGRGMHHHLAFKDHGRLEAWKAARAIGKGTA